MKALNVTGVCILLLSFFAFAGFKDDTKSAFNSFTVGLALPLSNSLVMTDPDTLTGPNEKKLKPGWEAGWTFFGKPFLKLENGLSGLAFGGRINYSRWNRDSTWTPVTLLGVQGIVRYYAPPLGKPFDVFAQVGGGLFIGEYGFSDPDTIDWGNASQNRIVTKGQNCFGFNVAAGVDFDVVEILPIVTIVKTKNDLSIWLSLNLGMTF